MTFNRLHPLFDLATEMLALLPCENEPEAAWAPSETLSRDLECSLHELSNLRVDLMRRKIEVGVRHGGGKRLYIRWHAFPYATKLAEKYIKEVYDA